MLTLITYIGHSVEGFNRLVDELRPHVDKWIVVKMPGIEIEKPGLTVVTDEVQDCWDASVLMNQGLSLIKEGWVLFLDSDEWLTHSQVSKIREFTEKQADTVDCVYMPRRNIESTKDWVGWPDYRPMLHRADRGITWGKSVDPWPVGAKSFIFIPLDSDYVTLHVHVDRKARERAELFRLKATKKDL